MTTGHTWADVAFALVEYFPVIVVALLYAYLCKKIIEAP